jgi:hypothetical protein
MGYHDKFIRRLSSLSLIFVSKIYTFICYTTSMLKILGRSLVVVLRKKEALFVLFASTILIFGAVLLIQKGAAIANLLNLPSLSFNQRSELIFSHLIDLDSSFTLGTLILALLSSILSGFNISLAYVYFKIHTTSILKNNAYSGVGLLLAIFGLGCAACGTAVLSVALGFFGLSAILLSLPYQGLEVGYLGLFILSVATYKLAQKVTAPKVC